jgi:hypothetical protein
MNSTYCGVVVGSNVTVFPSLFVRVTPVMLSVSSENWSFAVLDARRVTAVFPVSVDCDPFPPQPVMKVAAIVTVKANTRGKSNELEMRK